MTNPQSLIERSHVYRAASNKDSERVIELVGSVLAEYGLRLNLDTVDADLKDIEGHYFSRGGIFELWESGCREGSNQGLLGSYGLYPIDTSTCELRKMYFRREARGQGLGRQTLQRAVEQARRLGFNQITLETASVLKEAIRLYTKFGFVACNSEHLTERCDQAYRLIL